jgi:Lar family restriction alleviation protein
MSEQELEPCPFCGSNDVILDEPMSSDRYAVVCNECGAMGQEDEDGNIATAAWNIRPLEDALRARVEVLEAALREIRDLAPAKTRYELSEMADHALNGEVKE